MNNDRELLELAAKAAGIFEQGEWFNNYDVDTLVSQSFVVGDSEWNPLTDDGDALRLAVKLRFTIIDDGEDYADVITQTCICIRQELNNDPYAAARRAIVKAAAEIGKDMK